MAIRRYAQDTKVAVDRSVAEIQKLVRAAGATNWSFQEDDEAVPPRASIQFKVEGWVVRFTVLIPTLAEMTYSPAGRYRAPAVARGYQDQELRRRWRELVLLIRAKLVAINSGVVSLEEEFLPYVVLATGETVGQWAPPHLRELQMAAEEGRLPVALLPASIEEE